MNLPTGWVLKPFTECLEKEASSNKLKIQKTKFQEKGKYAIIDQSVDFIAGYTDDSSKIYKNKLPIIIFGDHTRIFKFITFPFALGADGTKILVPNTDILDPKYFYYFLSGLKLVSHGYSRHYKFLKEKQIIVPPLPTQKKIAAILEKAERLKEWRKEADRLTNELLKSTFLEMFGDPGNNDKNWKYSSIGENLIEIKYGTSSSPKYSDKGVAFIRATNIKNGKIIDEEMVFIDEFKAKKIEKCLLKKNDIIIVRSGINTGDSTYINEKYEGSYAGYDIIIRLNNNKLNSIFLIFLLNMKAIRSVLKKLSRRAGQPHINSKQISSLKIILPNIELQNKFANIVVETEDLQKKQYHSKQQIDELFNSLMQKAFKGELVC